MEAVHLQLAGRDLHAVASISHQIRHIAKQSFLMQIHAANAIVMSRSHGVHVPGFEVVSEQMRQLSKELGGCLSRLREATVRWLGVVSRQVADQRSRDVLALAATTTPAAGAAVAPALARLATERAEIVVARRAFVAVLDDARSAAATGCVLARTAKLEATYGQSIAAKLTEAAAAFTELADSVDDAVRAIARSLTSTERRRA